MSSSESQSTTYPPIEALADIAERCARRLKRADKVLAISHIDADGLTSAGIAAQMLERANIPYESLFYKQLDEDNIKEIAARDTDTVLFTDFGSGQLDIISTYEAQGDISPVIVDHHEPADAKTEYHLNPLLFDISGSSELSGAGSIYTVARAMSRLTDDSTNPDDETLAADNKDLAALALVGAVGDMQGGPEGVSGANEAIVSEGVEVGVIEEKTDITLYGKQTRPVPKLLEYSTDLRIPGITGSESGSIDFIENQEIDIQDHTGNWKHWVDLTQDEKSTLVNALIDKAIDSGVPANRINEIIGTTYELTNEEKRTSLRDVSEFSTLLNATARYERQDVGLAVCLGNRGQAYQEAQKLLKNHQKNISNGIDWVVETGTTKEENLQWIDCGDKIRDTIVGIIAGMALGEGNIEQHTPIVAFAHKETDDGDEAKLKISSRATRKLTEKGVDLSIVMETASQHVDGDGGGHDIAAGATIPADRRNEFIEKADEIITSQLNS